VPGEGVPHPLVLVVGEGPGADEDAAGRPFVGKAGQLLDRILSGIGLSRDKNCFIANVVKCRPPGNRDPLPAEIAACLPFLERQIDLLKPLAILAVGRVPANTLLNDDRGIGKLRGCFTEYRSRKAGGPAIPLLATYHPSALLRDEALKRPVWEDVKLLMGKLEGLDPAYAEEIRDLPVKRSGSRQGTQEG
jgi:DNA polymerase